MRGICLVDTSIFVQILNIPFMSDNHNQIVEEL